MDRLTPEAVREMQERLKQYQKALDKQIPEKLSYEGDGYDDDGNIIYDTAICPDCKKRFEVDYDEHSAYCPDCGKALDWMVEE